MKEVLLGVASLETIVKAASQGSLEQDDFKVLHQLLKKRDTNQLSLMAMAQDAKVEPQRFKQRFNFLELHKLIETENIL